MDTTPNYLPFTEQVRAMYDRIGRSLPDELWILVVLRDPAAWEFSLYNHKANLYRSHEVAQE